MKGNPARKYGTNGSEPQHTVVKACDMCRKKKIRCEVAGDSCVQCIKYKTICHFTPISMKSKPRRPAGYKNAQELEERLRRMEALLKIAVEKRNVGSQESGPEDQNPAPYRREVDLAGQMNSVGEGCPSMSTPESLGINTPVTSRSHATQFGQGTETPDQNARMLYEPMSTNGSPSPTVATRKGRVVHDVFSHNTFQELPPKSVALGLVDEAFRSFNSSYPIFDERSFMQRFQDRYSESGPSDPTWWACINVVLALAHRFRAMRTLETAHENSAACGNMQSALGVVSELTLQHNSLPAVQALLGMTVILQGTPSPRLCSVLIAVCIRLAQTMGLHRTNQDPNLTEAEIEERKNVFWMAYLLDKDVSFRTGQPPAQDDDDVDVELPSGGAFPQFPPAHPNSNEVNTFNFFNVRLGLAIIQGQIYKKLACVKAARQPEAQRLVAAQELDAMLARWRSQTPLDFEDGTIITLQPPVPPEILHMIILRFSYVNVLIAIHRYLPSPSGSQMNPDNPPIDSALGAQPTLSSESICVVEARKAMRLIQMTPQGDYAISWLLIHFFFAAVTTLLQNVVLNPAYHSASSDLLLIGPFIRLLDVLGREQKSEEAQRMYDICVELNGKAEQAVERVNRLLFADPNGSREQGEKESVEEFIQRVECISSGCPSSQLGLLPWGEGVGETWGNGDSTLTNLDNFSEFDILDM